MMSREIPVLFNTEMVKAILAARKTQTRRPMRFQSVAQDIHISHEHILTYVFGPDQELTQEHCPTQCSPFGKPGDVLWVRERLYFDFEKGWSYWADESLVVGDYSNKRLSCPSIHMPKSACRLKLKVKRVWVERVQDIEQTDIWSEGVQFDCNGMSHAMDDGNCGISCDDCPSPIPAEQWEALWNSIYGTWAANPWVWCCEFERIDQERDHE
jgi:hypothetical protein